MARANRLSEQVPMKVALKEVMPTKFLPYARHVTDEVVVLDSGAIMLTFELQGRAFETADVRDLNDWHAKLNGMLRNLHDDRLSIWTHLVRARVEQYPGGNFRSRFARDRSEEHTSELQSLMRLSYAVFCLNKKKSNIYNSYNKNEETQEK